MEYYSNQLTPRRHSGRFPFNSFQIYDAEVKKWVQKTTVRTQKTKAEKIVQLSFA